MRAGDFSAARHWYELLVAGQPSPPAGVVINLASLLNASDQADRAIDLLSQVLGREPDNASALYNLANIHLRFDRYDLAIPLYRNAAALRPGHSNTLINLARCLARTFEADAAMSLLRRAFEIEPSKLALTNLIFQSMYCPHIDLADFDRLGKLWDAHFKPPLPAIAPSAPAGASAELGRPLRVGYFASTFRDHPVGHMIAAVIAAHRRTRVEVHVFSDVRQPDDVTRQIRDAAPHFHDTARLGAAQWAQFVSRQRIDILVDLECHSGTPRLDALALAPAPIRVNYCYPFSAGCSVHTHRVTDTLIEPAGTPALGPERLVRLPTSFWSSRPLLAADNRPGHSLPCGRTGQFTFASLNNPRKVNLAHASLWSRILSQLPSARLLLYSPNPASHLPFFKSLFTNAGLSPESFSRQIQLLGPLPRHAHLARYLDIDLSLDTFPYGGHTTTLDSLLMGTPVLTLTGPLPISRVAESMLHRAQLPQLIMQTPDDYVSTAVRLAQTPDLLERLRAGLPQKLAATSAGNPALVARALEEAYQALWRTHCQSLPPADLDLSGPAAI